jgi:hypothetical protein
MKVIHKPGPAAARLARIVQGISDMHARVGFLGGGAGYEKGKVTPAYLAVIHENGAPEKGIPPRPFMTPVAGNPQKVEEWRKRARAAWNEYLAGRGSIAGIFHQVGGRAAEDVRQSIEEVFKPPLKPATIAARARKKARGLEVEKLAKPLIETGTMLESVTYDVRGGRDEYAE